MSGKGSIALGIITVGASLALALGFLAPSIRDVRRAVSKDGEDDEDDDTKDSPIGKLGDRKNVTDKVSPAPDDVNDPAPPGSPIVGEAHSGFPAEEHRIQNLQRRWKLLQRWGALERGPQGLREAWERWRTFGTRREQRSMKGWDKQFRDLIAAEDWAAARGFRVRREDSSHLDDRAWEASLR